MTRGWIAASSPVRAAGRFGRFSAAGSWVGWVGVIFPGTIELRAMAWTDRIFNYCERGGSAAFWGEPLNALSNAAFLLAALAALIELRSRGAREPIAVPALIALVFVIGAGSFLFHTLANRWSALADVLPIGLFMFAYLGYALRSFYGIGWLWIAPILVLFAWTLEAAAAIECQGFAGIAAFSRGSCLNGTMRYAPAFAALLATGAGLAALRRPAGKYLIAASAFFLVSMAFRSMDWAACDQTRLLGRLRGTHAAWHLFNGLTLYILLLAAIRHGGRDAPGCHRPPAKA